MTIAKLELMSAQPNDEEFQWATHFNAQAHFRQEYIHSPGPSAWKFQWATHFNAQAHRFPTPSGPVTATRVSMGYSC